MLPNCLRIQLRPIRASEERQREGFIDCESPGLNGQRAVNLALSANLIYFHDHVDGGEAFRFQFSRRPAEGSGSFANVIVIKAIVEMVED